MTQCSAITKAGKQCSVTSSSNWRDDRGRLVAEPLLKGGGCCLFHAKPFCTEATQVDDFERLVNPVVVLVAHDGIPVGQPAT